MADVMMAGLGGQTVTVIERTPIGRGDYRDGARVPYPGCAVQPMTSEEQVRHGLTVTRRWKLYGPAEFAATARSEVEVDGLTDERGAPLRLDVFGAVELWRDEHGTADHTRAMLMLVEGA